MRAASKGKSASAGVRASVRRVGRLRRRGRWLRSAGIFCSILGGLVLAAPAQAAWSVGGARNPDGSYRGPVTVMLSAADEGSGVCHIFYTLDGGPQVDSTANPTSFQVAPDGPHAVEFFAEDCAGNQSAPETFGWQQSSATLTPLPTATPTVTRTPLPTATTTPTLTPTQTQAPAPVVVTLAADYANLILFASRVDMPAQTLRCAVAGGARAPFDVLVEVSSPGGVWALYDLQTDGSGVCALTPALARDPDFGTTAQGLWSARAYSGGKRSNTVVWNVAWFTVHERP